jgi:hypothetical protein
MIIHSFFVVKTSKHKLQLETQLNAISNRKYSGSRYLMLVK